MGFSAMFHFFTSDALQLVFFFFVYEFKCMHAKSYVPCSILFKMTAITKSSISIRTPVMITKLATNQTATVRVM